MKSEKLAISAMLFSDINREAISADVPIQEHEDPVHVLLLAC